MLLTIDNFSNNILKEVSFKLKCGDNLTILGSNGVGKTTLAKVLCGIDPSDCVTINSLKLSNISGVKRAELINYIPSKLNIFDEYITVQKFLELGTFHKNLKVDEALELLQIYHLKNSSCHTLSSGESQLLLMASALLHNATYTIFDEPTANLDPQKIQLIFSILKNKSMLQSKIIITHNLDLAYRLGFNILFLEEGRVKFHADSKSFFLQENLDKLYDGSVKNTIDNIVVNL
jgi:iron complex transport system ATP-binding protein